jgi:hypothetical protein
VFVLFKFETQEFDLKYDSFKKSAFKQVEKINWSERSMCASSSNFLLCLFLIIYSFAVTFLLEGVVSDSEWKITLNGGITQQPLLRSNNYVKLKLRAPN